MVRKTLVTKFTITACVLLISICIFTFHNSKLQPHYETIKSWSKSNDKVSKTYLKHSGKNVTAKSAATEKEDTDYTNYNYNNGYGKDLSDNPEHEEYDEYQPDENGENSGSKQNKAYGSVNKDSKHTDLIDIANSEEHKYGTIEVTSDDDYQDSEYFKAVAEFNDDDYNNPDVHDDWDENRKASMDFINKQASEDPHLKKRQSVFKRVFELISDCKPNIEPLKDYSNGPINSEGSSGFDEPYMTKDELLKHLIVSEEAQKDLKEQHEKLVKHLPNYFQSIYDTGSSGIVYVGGNRFSWLTLLSIINMRQNNCQLGVEVLIPKYEEFELNICQNVLPKYNAKCIYLPTLVGHDIFEKYDFKGYQYKSLALTLSSFENVLLLDADNTALIDPTTVFKSEPFRSHGLITWPDFWKRTTHPAFYDIVGFDIDETKRRDKGYNEYGKYFKAVAPDDITLYHQLENTIPGPTTESGQMFISKRKHFKALILSLFYNTYGPGYYYPLLSQGAAGEGDKETFVAAAHALGTKFYDVKKRVTSFGADLGDRWRATAMGQYNPIQDFEISEKYRDSEDEVKENPDVFFIHSNIPKLDPWALKVDDNSLFKGRSNRIRLLSQSFIDIAKYDYELRIWKIMEQLVCDDKIEFYTFKVKGVDNAEVCGEILQQLIYLHSTTRDVKK